MSQLHVIGVISDTDGLLRPEAVEALCDTESNMNRLGLGFYSETGVHAARTHRPGNILFEAIRGSQGGKKHSTCQGFFANFLIDSEFGERREDLGMEKGIRAGLWAKTIPYHCNFLFGFGWSSIQRRSTDRDDSSLSCEPRGADPDAGLVQGSNRAQRGYP
jgi:hypothetical protein